MAQRQVENFVKLFDAILYTPNLSKKTKQQAIQDADEFVIQRYFEYMNDPRFWQIDKLRPQLLAAKKLNLLGNKAGVKKIRFLTKKRKFLKQRTIKFLPTLIKVKLALEKNGKSVKKPIRNQTNGVTKPTKVEGTEATGPGAKRIKLEPTKQPASATIDSGDESTGDQDESGDEW